MRTFPSQAGGSKLFEFVVVLVLLGILSMMVLEFMRHYIEAAEKSAMEATVMQLRGALRLRLAEVLAEDETAQAESLIRGNPMDWLQDKPDNYAGIFDAPPPGVVKPGNWYFDTKSRELVYLVKHGREFVPGKDGLKQVRLRVNAPAIDMAAKERQLYVEKMIMGVSLTLVVPYVWEFK